MAASFLSSIREKDQVVLSADLLMFLEIIQRARPRRFKIRPVAIRCSWAQAMSVPHMEQEEKFSCK